MTANNLRAYRHSIAGMTQAKLAKIVGITVAGYQKLEYGHYKPRHATAQKLAKALDVPAETLFPVEGSGKEK